MSEFYEIPLAGRQISEYSQRQVDDFFSAIALIPENYLQDICDGFNRDYRVPDRDAKQLLEVYAIARNLREDRYFKNLEVMRTRLLVTGKPIIVNKK